MSRDFFNENRLEKITRRLKEEPLIPFGVGLTVWAFLNAAKSIRTGNSARTNQYFRYRLYAQSFTLVAMIGGSFYYNADRLKRKEYTDLVNKKKAQGKRDAWIRELEARDLEDKEWREKLGKVRDFEREELEREAIEEKRRREGRGEDRRGLIGTGKGKMKDVKEDEQKKEAVELEQGKELAKMGIEEKRRREDKSDDGRGVIAALKGKMRDAKNDEADREAAELEQRKELMKAKRQEMEKKQEAERTKQEAVKLEAGMGPDTRVWGEAGGGLFGWKRIRDLFNRPRDGEGGK